MKVNCNPLKSPSGIKGNEDKFQTSEHWGSGKRASTGEAREHWGSAREHWGSARALGKRARALGKRARALGKRAPLRLFSWTCQRAPLRPRERSQGRRDGRAW